MAGHSKWHNIKHKKAKEDAKKGLVFTKLSKEITISSKAHGGDPATNIGLRILLEKARSENMPKDNIERAIKKGTGALEGVNYEEITYEGYGPSNVAVMVQALTDNRNRTISDLRHVFSKQGGRLAEAGAVSWMFELQGQVQFDPCSKNEEDLLEILLEADIIDLQMHPEENLATVTCSVENLDKVKHFIDAKKFIIKSAELAWIAKTKVTVSEEDQEKVMEFLDKLDDLDDVKNFFVNLE